MKVAFSKMHGLGNDFIIVDDRHQRLENAEAFARRFCARRFGVGADQLLVARPARDAESVVRMDIYNADGGQVEMCGNGLRAFALFGKRLGFWEDGQSVETAGAVTRPRVVGEGQVEVDMGVPRWDPKFLPVDAPSEVVNERRTVGGGEWEITCVSIGNPHCVIFTDALTQVALDIVGPKIETDPLFPKRVNVEFVQVRAPDQLAVRVWERGAGATLACGSGACAALVAAVRTGRCVRKCEVRLPGGSLQVEWRESNDHVYQSGPAVEVFSGSVEWAP